MSQHSAFAESGNSLAGIMTVTISYIPRGTLEIVVSRTVFVTPAPTRGTDLAIGTASLQNWLTPHSAITDPTGLFTMQYASNAVSIFSFDTIAIVNLSPWVSVFPLVLLYMRGMGEGVMVGVKVGVEVGGAGVIGGSVPRYISFTASAMTYFVESDPEFVSVISTSVLSK